MKAHMALNILNLDERKTEIVVFVPVYFRDSPDGYLTSLAPTINRTQINSGVKSIFIQLRAEINFEKMIHVYILPRFDYFNMLYTEMSQSSLTSPQLVQNTAVLKHNHISHILACLHWLPVRYRIELLHLHTLSRALRFSD